MNVSPFILRLRYSDRKQGERKQEVSYKFSNAVEKGKNSLSIMVCFFFNKQVTSCSDN